MNQLANRNILFIEENLNPFLGGVERVSYLLSNAFSSYGANCFWLYSNINNSNYDDSKIFKYSLLPNQKSAKSEIVDFVLNNNIDTVVNQGIINNNIIIATKKLKKKKKKNINLIFCFHMSPGFELLLQNENNLYSSLKQKIKNFIGYNKLYSYKEIYNIYDNLVLLSERFIPKFKQNYNLIDINKICSIPNPLTFEKKITTEELKNKKNTVLIVSRMLDCHKNISSALKIWSNLRNYGYNDWCLKIVGDGPDLEQFKNYVLKANLKNVFFEGSKSNVLPYYQEAKVFIMTSKFEGFGMTLTEAQQNGCVPIVFDNFDTLHDIVINNYNGFIIESNNEILFMKKLNSIINLNEDLSVIMKNGIDSSEKFHINYITQKWINLLNRKIN